MPATYTPLTLQQMGELLTPQGFRIIDLTNTAEMVYGKIIAKSVCLRVYTTIDRTGYSRDCGADAIRVTAVKRYPGDVIRGIGKTKRIHRTQNWRVNLQKRIDEMIAQFGDPKRTEVQEQVHA